MLDLVNGLVRTFATYNGSLHMLSQNVLDYAGRVVKTTTYDGRGGQYVSTQSYDSAGRLEQTIDAVGTVRKTVYDALGRPVSESIGDSPTNLICYKTYQYDNGQAGDGNLTLVIEDPGIGEPRRTKMEYDWRDQLVKTIAGDGTSIKLTTETQYDNLGRPTSTRRLDSLDALVLTTNLTYNAAGHLETSVQLAPTGETLTTSYEYDGRGNVTRTVQPDGQATERQIQRLGGADLASHGRARFQSVCNRDVH